MKGSKNTSCKLGVILLRRSEKATTNVPFADYIYGIPKTTGQGASYDDSRREGLVTFEILLWHASYKLLKVFHLLSLSFFQVLKSAWEPDVVQRCEGLDERFWRDANGGA